MVDYSNLNTAYSYIGHFYNKILLINLSDDNFCVIKADDNELDKLPNLISLSEWVKDFVESPYFKPYGQNRSPQEFTKYYDLDYLKSLKAPLLLKYQKLINGEYHDMELVFLNIGSEMAYIYVRDNTKLMA